MANNVNGNFENIYSDIIHSICSGGVNFEESIDNNRLNDDPYQTIQQEQRDILITELLSTYVDNYRNKSYSNPKYKKVILYSTLIAIGILMISLLVLVYLSTLLGFGEVSLYIGSFVTLIGLPIGVLKIITGYVFPKEEEKYINSVVESIQTNDLENKKININVNNNGNEKGKDD